MRFPVCDMSNRGVYEELVADRGCSAPARFCCCTCSSENRGSPKLPLRVSFVRPAESGRGSGVDEGAPISRVGPSKSVTAC